LKDLDDAYNRISSDDCFEPNWEVAKNYTKLIQLGIYLNVYLEGFHYFYPEEMGWTHFSGEWFPIISRKSAFPG